MTLKIGIVGGSGYTGGELIRLLLSHPEVEISQVTASEKNLEKYIHSLHPNLRNRTNLKFSGIDNLESCDLLFLSLPHGHSMREIDKFREFSDKIIDLSGDFRLNDPKVFEKYYSKKHTRNELMKDFVYGIPELHREEMKNAKLISSAGCNATAVILGLYPLFSEGIIENKVIVEVKGGSSEGGNSFSYASHHPERSGAVRSYKPTMHRHIAEMEQELPDAKIHFSATSIEMVRGILATSHVFLKDENITEKDIWKIYRRFYSKEPFIRIVKEKRGIYRYPEPKILTGSNYCDIGFEKDECSNRLVVISAIDNLMKGAAGQAIQAFNIMNGFDETLGLEFPGLHPI